MAISSIAPIAVNGVQNQGSVGQGASGSVEQIGKSFGEVLDSLSRSETQTDNLVTRLSMGEDVDLHDVMINMEQTDIEFRVAMAIRDKLVDAYREIMRMQV